MGQRHLTHQGQRELPPPAALQAAPPNYEDGPDSLDIPMQEKLT